MFDERFTTLKYKRQQRRTKREADIMQQTEMIDSEHDHGSSGVRSSQVFSNRQQCHADNEVVPQRFVEERLNGQVSPLKKNGTIFTRKKRMINSVSNRRNLMKSRNTNNYANHSAHHIGPLPSSNRDLQQDTVGNVAVA